MDTSEHRVLKTPLLDTFNEEQTIIVQLQRTQSYIGVALTVASSFCFSLSFVIVKLMYDFNAIQLAAVRFIGILLPSAITVLWREEKVFPEGKRCMLVLRALLGTVRMLLIFYALSIISLGKASALIFCTPIYTKILAYIFLKEPYSIISVLIVCISIFGVILIAEPNFVFPPTSVGLESNQWGIIAALICPMLGAGTFVVLRSLNDVHPSVTVANFGFFSSLMTLNLAYWSGVWIWPSGTNEWILCIALALLGYSAQILLTSAFKYENAGNISIARSADILFGFMWDMIVFHEIPSIYSALGATVIIGAVLMTTLHNVP